MRSFISLFLLSFSLLSFAQERQNKPLPKFSPFNSQLTLAKGWRQQPDGQWMGRANRIPVEVDSSSKALVDYETWGCGTDNFVYYQLHKMVYLDQNYVVLIKKSKSGYYKYQSIQKGWRNTFTYYYVVFTENDFNTAFSDLKDEEVNKIKMRPKYAGYILSGVEATHLKDISADIASEEAKEEKDFIFRIAPYKNKKIVQFLFYDSEERQYSSTYGLSFLVSCVFSPEDIDGIYYETSLANFKTFIKIP